MAFEQNQIPYTIVGSVDLRDSTPGTGKQYKVIDLVTGNVALKNTAAAGGILRYGGNVSEHATLGVQGIMKFTAYQTVGAGARLSIYSGGYMGVANSGDLVYGKALDAAVGSGAIGTGFFNFANPTPFDSSSLYGFPTVVVFSAASNLSAAALLGSAIDIRSGDIATAAVGSQNAHGVLVSSPLSGTIGYVQADGIALVRAGGVITRGRSLTVAVSGFWIDADCGLVVQGRALAASASTNSGGTFTAVINMATPHYATNCLDIMY